MKSFVSKLGIALLLAGGPAIFAQSAGQDMKDAGRSVKDAGKDTGRAVKKTGHKVKKGTKKGINKAAGKTERGAARVKDKTSQ